MTDELIEDLDASIAAVRENLRQLIGEAAIHSGAADEQRTEQRIAEQEARLEALKRRRADLA